MTPEQLMAALREPFPAESIGWKPGATSGSRALALPYIDARDVMDRLDAVFGVAGWEDEYEAEPDGSTVCTLRVRIGDQWVSKMDVGGASDQPDEGDRRKASFSDALKRAAVKFGIGRYLYALPPVWCDWDPQKKRFVVEPKLPASALPGHKPPARVAAAPTNGGKAGAGAQRVSRVSASNLPANGAELEQRLKSREAKLVAEGLCQAGDLITAVTAAGVKAGYVKELVRWPAAAMRLAAEEATAFVAKCKAGNGPVHAG